MSFDVYLPFIAAAAFGTLGVRLAQRLRPAQATWLLSSGAVITSACSLCSLLLLAWALVGQISVVASIGDWSAARFRYHDPVSLGVSIPAAAILAIVCVSATRALLRHVRSLAQAYRTCRQLPPAIGELLVVADDSVDACALPGRRGRIVVSQGTLSRLSAAQREAVFAHERSHLEHRHHLHQVAVALAAAANPLLRATPRATSYAVERWADEDAARQLHAPETVATALCGAALGEWATRSDPARRIAALRRPARPRRRGGWLVVVFAAAGFLGLLAISAEATSDAGQLWHHASETTRPPGAG